MQLLLSVFFAILFLLDKFPSTSFASPQQKASKARAEGDEALVKGTYDVAIEKYSIAIRLEPKEVKNYQKRLKAFERAKKIEAAILDLDTILILLNNNDVSALFSRGKHYLSLGKCIESFSDFDQIVRQPQNENNAKTKQEASKMYEVVRECARLLMEAEGAISSRDFGRAEQLLTLAIEKSNSNSPHIKKKRANVRFENGNLFECIADAGEVVKHDRNQIDVLELRGRAYFATGDEEMAIKHTSEALQLDPDHKSSKILHKLVTGLRKLRSAGEKFLEKGEAKEAIAKFNEALNSEGDRKLFHSHTKSKLFLLICRAELLLKMLPEARKSCDKAYELNNHAEPKVVLAEALLKFATEANDFEEVVRLYRQALEKDENNESLHEALRRAEAALKQSKEKNYYKILNVPRNADLNAIKKAYRKMAKELHPDRHPNLSPEDLKVLEQKFSLVAEAHEVLSDPELKRKYDLGEPVFENQGGEYQHHQQHPFFRRGGFPGGGGGFRFHFG